MKICIVFSASEVSSGYEARFRERWSASSARMGRRDIQNRSGRCGFYFAVAEEGEVGAGDAFEFLEREKPTLSIADVNRLYASKSPDRETLKRSLDVKTLPESWRARFRARLSEVD